MKKVLHNENIKAGLKDPHCLLSDASVFLGFASMPLLKEDKFLVEIEAFFARYQNDTASYMSAEKQNKFKEHFYIPSSYILLSNFDVAFLSLIDDHEFGVQTFIPSHPTRCKVRKDSTKEPLPFYHQTTLGPCPRWNEEETGNEDIYNRQIIGIAKKTFLKTNKNVYDYPPLIGICQVEVNTSFLVGSGDNFLRCLVKAFDSFFQSKFANSKQNSHVLFLESHSWNELTIILFSRSFSEIIDFVKGIREKNFFDIGYDLCQKQFEYNRSRVQSKNKTDSYWKDWEKLIQLEDVYSLDKTISLNAKRNLTNKMKELFKNKKYINRGSLKEYQQLKQILHTKPFGANVIFNTTTALGFTSDILKKANALINDDQKQSNLNAILAKFQIENQDNLYLIRDWTAKAGHLKYASEALTTEETDGKLIVTVGRRDFYYPHTKPLCFNRLSSRDIVYNLINNSWLLSDWKKTKGKLISQEESAGILAVHSTVAKEIQPDDSPPPQSHCGADRTREEFVYKCETITELFNNAKRLQLPKAIIEKLLIMIELYNQGIRDNFLFSSFLELKPYLDFITVYLNEGGEYEETERMTETLNGFIDNFETGWRNRFHGSWRLGDVSELNLSFKGGIQQLVSAFHDAYRILSEVFTTNDRVLVVIKGDPGILTKSNALQINLFDIFKPEFFAARVGHEAAETLHELCKANIFREKFLNKYGIEYDNLFDITTASLNDLNKYSQEKQEILSCKYQNIIYKKLEISPECRNILETLIIPPQNIQKHFRFFNQLYADICNYSTVYLYKTELYIFWWLISFVVDPINWYNSRQINEDNLHEALLRMFLTIRKECNSYEDEQILRTTKEYWCLLQNENHGWVHEINTTIQKIFDLSTILLKSDATRELQTWIKMVNDFVRRGVLKSPNAKNILRERSSIYQSYLQKGRAIVGGEHRQSFNFKSNSKNYSTDLYDLDCYYDFCDIISLFNAYLVIIRNKCTIQEGGQFKCRGDFLLPRNENGIITFDKSQIYAPILFDKRGGTFIQEPEVRRENFMMRSAVVMSLYDIAEKSKLEWCKKARIEKTIKLK